MKNKKHLWLFVLLFSFTTSIFNVVAHPGRTDENGGHWNRKIGEYHFHTGEYAGRESSGNSSVSESSDNPPKNTSKKLSKEDKLKRVQNLAEMEYTPPANVKTEGTKYDRARAILGTDKVFDGEKTYEVTNQSGQVLGTVSYDAKEAIEKNKLDSYKPKNDEEKRVIDILLQEAKNKSISNNAKPYFEENTQHFPKQNIILLILSLVILLFSLCFLIIKLYIIKQNTKKIKVKLYKNGKTIRGTITSNKLPQNYTNYVDKRNFIHIYVHKSGKTQMMHKKEWESRVYFIKKQKSH